MHINQLKRLHERAVRGSVELVNQVTQVDLHLRTPCSAWTLGELVAHMTVQHEGFAAAAAGGRTDPAVWRARPSQGDPAAEHAAAAERVIEAFAKYGLPDREFWLPEISVSRPISAERAISFHFVDYVVHGWDVAMALGAHYPSDPELTDAALAVAEAVPDGPERLEPGAAFRPGLAVDPAAGALERLLARLGRSAGWSR